MWRGLRKNGAKNQKLKILPRVPGQSTRGSYPFPREPCPSTRKRASSSRAKKGTRKRFFLFFSCKSADGLDRQVTLFFPECGSSQVLHLGKRAFTEFRSSPSAQYSAALKKTSFPRVQFFPECNTQGRLASPECPFFSTQESLRHSGNFASPMRVIFNLYKTDMHIPRMLGVFILLLMHVIYIYI